jgi:hypothetical protein
MAPEQKQKLVESRFQEIKIKDYRIVSLYLLTGEIVTPDPLDMSAQNAPDGTKCYSCQRPLPISGLVHREADVVYCDECFDGIAVADRRRSELERESSAIPLAHSATLSWNPSNDTSQRL